MGYLPARFEIFFMSKTISQLFLKSALTLESPATDLAKTRKWLEQRNLETIVNVHRTRFSKLNQWLFDEDAQNLRHVSGNFFSIDGIRISTNWGTIPSWEQPIINQPEIGFLGIIAKEIDGVLHFLMQAKIEPGNVNNVQLSPTLQATRSNYTQVHKGNKPKYLEYFTDKTKIVLLDQLQSEQGARFLKKRNRNIIIQVSSDLDLPVYEDFCWLTLGQIIELTKFSNVVNMDTRTVISGIPFGDYEKSVVDFYTDLHAVGREGMGSKFLKSCLNKDESMHSFDDILSWLTGFKSIFDLKIDKIPLKKVSHWHVNDEEIFHEDKKYFKVIPVEVEISSREVRKWNQPLVEPVQEGICGFIVKEINGILHFLVQAKLECGNFDIIEFAPTVQCLTGNYKDNTIIMPLYLDVLLNAAPNQVIIDNYQSEEGGRFYREQNRNMIIKVGAEFPTEVHENFIWLTLNQLKTFLKYNNFLNIQARSLISAISFV